MIKQIAYISASEVGDFAAQMDDILETSRRNNAARGITGVLIYAQGMFFQLLEGEKDTLAEVYETISRDGRHEGVTPLMNRTSDQRLFTDWSMGWHRVPDDHPSAARIRALGHPETFRDRDVALDAEVEALIEAFFELNQV